MERKIAECTTYKELDQVMCNLSLFYIGSVQEPTTLVSFLFNLAKDAQDRIDSYELGNDPADDSHQD